jgi:PD-(D/E)XK nuclease superfamily
LFEQWFGYRNLTLDYARGDTWDSMLHEGIHLLERFAQDDRVHIRNPRRNLQVQVVRRLSSANEFVAYIDAIGELDHKHAIIDWKTSAARYPDQPAGLLALDPQLVCYSWITGEPEVAFVVFVRKRLPEVQYLRATITDDQRQQFGQLVQETVKRIETGQFLPRSGIRFPQNGCLSCPFLGLCLGNQQLADSKLNRRPGAKDLAWLDELHY